MNPRTPNAIDKELGARIKEVRRAHKLTQTDVAQHIGTSFQQVQKIERGQNRVSVGRLFGIAEILETKPEALIKGLGRR